MRLKARLDQLEQRAKTVNAAAQKNPFDLDFEAMSDEEIDVLLKNLLIASGKPPDAAAGQLWDQLFSTDELTPGEWQTLLQFYQDDTP